MSEIVEAEQGLLAREVDNFKCEFVVIAVSGVPAIFGESVEVVLDEFEHPVEVGEIALLLAIVIVNCDHFGSFGPDARVRNGNDALLG